MRTRAEHERLLILFWLTPMFYFVTLRGVPFVSFVVSFWSSLCLCVSMVGIGFSFGS
jgi:hypothetical protein